jgi:ABC-type microcin C transport system permease subunit YejE
MAATFFYSGSSQPKLFASQNLQPRMGFFRQSRRAVAAITYNHEWPPPPATQANTGSHEQVCDVIGQLLLTFHYSIILF